MISLVERQGMLLWDLAPQINAQNPRLRRARPHLGILGRLVGRKEFKALGPNEVGGFLARLDEGLTPSRGLRQWREPSQKLENIQTVSPTGRILLFIHGTFSKSEHLFDDLTQTVAGQTFLGRASTKYNQILAFDHATVSVSPMLNAVDLRNMLGNSTAEVDIVCHSRGGLVARWWMEIFDLLPARKKRAVFVASPLNGTSLASPVRLRAGLNAMATLSKLLGTVGMAVPFMSAPLAILRVMGSVVAASTRAPLVDAALAMIPGLNGQSRVDNNPELLRLNGNKQNIESYNFVVSNFQSSSPGWQFWRYITEGKRIAEAAADLLVFPGNNDLVVDTASMTEIPGLAPIAAASLYDFGTNGRVHHTNYFQMEETISFIQRCLDIV
jgi:alpha-beta hydrolase superfamily lysophospholipase